MLYRKLLFLSYRYNTLVQLDQRAEGGLTCWSGAIQQWSTNTVWDMQSVMRNFTMQSSPDCSVLALLTLNIITVFQGKSSALLWMHELQTVALRTAHKLTPPARPSITKRRGKHGLLSCFLSVACKVTQRSRLLLLLLLLLSQSSDRVVLLKLCQNLCSSLHATSLISLHT